MSWQAFKGGETLRTLGSEGGEIVADDEHPEGARITLESKCKHVPFAITCGIYGWFVHTTYASTLSEAERTYRAMRAELERIVRSIPAADASDVQERMRVVSDDISSFVARFP